MPCALFNWGHSAGQCDGRGDLRRGPHACGTAVAAVGARLWGAIRARGMPIWRGDYMRATTLGP
eukprot:1775862-Pyramimonas_sp.AAC.1